MASATLDQSHELAFDRTAEGDLTIHLAGAWRLHRGMARDLSMVEDALNQGVRRIAFTSARLESWDTALLSFLVQLKALAGERQITIDHQGLPQGVERLLELADTAPHATPPSPATRSTIVGRMGAATLSYADSFRDALEFVGAIAIAFARMVTGRARYQGADILALIQACGANALAIVALISFLVGVILAFMGAVQLQQFGASIYVADLVAIGMTREMGAMMTAVIMAGRTGAAFAAQLGTMKVRQEVEAFKTMGISPVEFLVAPRVIALVLMMPLLCLYADFIGVFGGACIGVGMLHLTFTAYLTESAKALYPATVFGGLFKSLVYGMLIAIAGCFQGMRCGNSASSVGDAATAAVVDGIILVVVACGLFALVFNVIGI